MQSISGRLCAKFFLAALALGAQPPLTRDQQIATSHITADSLRGHVSFLSSDLLEGRPTPSRGLDLAAEYIAAQFRRAGLEPLADGTYFQTADLRELGARAAQIVPPGASSKVRNVAGILRGSDLVLRDTYVMLTSHYDHRPMAAAGEDRIFNGANDDASGTTSVIEVAAALAALPVHPKRSILFMTFFGEERGLLGSRYYAQHPLVPPAKTIAGLNLEQIGRTDATEGPQIKTASVTGFDFSDMPGTIAKAAELAGVQVYNNAAASDAFFGRSDNQPLAALGIPAHTLCVAFDFPDYHKVTDTWEKLDYDNMAVVNRAIALAMMELASDAPAPKWNEAYPPAQRYAEAARKLHP
jgi:hypothetical protein